MAIPAVVFVKIPEPHIPPPPDPGRVHYRLWLEGWDGSNWALHDDTSGLTLMRGVRGLAGITLENHRDAHASIPGSRWRDFRATDREIFLPIHLFHDGDSYEWVKHNRDFVRLFRGGKTVWLHIVHPDGTHRKIEAHYENGLEEALEIDPAFYGWASYGIYLNAEQPYWQAAEPITRVFKTPEPVFFFGGQPVATGVETGVPPLGITDERTLTNSTITNEGDTDVRPVIRIYNSTTASVGVGNQVVTVPFAVSSGYVLTIDCNPQHQTAILTSLGPVATSVDKTKDLGTFGFPKIPPGANLPLVTDVTGVGSRIEIDITPLYEWGLS